MQPMVTIALRAARAASEHIVRATERLDLIKSEKQDVARFVADTCQQVEKTIVHTLQKAYPSHTVIGEYTGTHEPAETGPQFTWHVTPIDSITNFISGLPQVAISIAGFQNKKLEHAIVLNPAINEEFTASRGRGAQLNGRRLRVSDATSLEGAVVATGYYNRTSDKAYLAAHQAISKDIFTLNGQVFSTGSSTLNLAYLAAGRADALFQFGLTETEYNAGLLLIQEAGALIADVSGSSNYRESGNLVAGNAKMLKALVQRTRPATQNA